jgi:hypothetical membrane protein
MRWVSATARDTSTAPAPPSADGNDGPGVPWWGLVSALAAPLLLAAGSTIAAILQPRPVNAVASTVSDLSGLGATDRWVMTLAFAAAGACEIVTALALRLAATPGRLLLMAAGVGGMLVAANPEHAGGSLAHAYSAGINFTALVSWPLGAWRRGLSVPWGLRPAVAAVAVGIMTCLFAVFLAEEVTRGGQIGLAERIMGIVQVGWPFAVVLSCRLHRLSGQTAPVGVDTEHAARAPARARHPRLRCARRAGPGDPGRTDPIEQDQAA